MNPHVTHQTKVRTGLAAYVILSLGMLFALYSVQSQTEAAINKEIDRVSEVLYQDNLAACERNNRLRRVVYENTKEAALFQPNASYVEQLRLLRSTPFFVPGTGEVDCVAATPKP